MAPCFNLYLIVPFTLNIVILLSVFLKLNERLFMLELEAMWCAEPAGFHI